MTAIIRYTINHKPLLMITAGVTGVLLGKGCEWLRANPQNGKINNVHGKSFVTGLEKIAEFALPIFDFVGKALIAAGSIWALSKAGVNCFAKPKKVISKPPILLNIRVTNLPLLQRLGNVPMYRIHNGAWRPFVSNNCRPH